MANSILSGQDTTVFETMSQLARKHEAINLGQGFPDDRGPGDMLEYAAQMLLTGNNQYPPMMGVPELRQAVAEHNRRHFAIEADWSREIMVTSGATEALAAAILGLINPGDEVVLFEPLYDSYLPMVRRAGGIARFVRLQPPNWSLSLAALDQAFAGRPQLVILNNPQNPATKVFTVDELCEIARRCIASDAVLIADEVYEHIVFDKNKHVSMININGMRDRTVKIGSAGKTFSVTGWKVGYVTASPNLLESVAKAHQFLVFTTPPNLQMSVAFGLGKPISWFQQNVSSEMQRRRDRLANGLRNIGFDLVPVAGTYFLVAGIDRLAAGENDVAFCRRLVIEAGVAAIPVSAFYADRDNTLDSMDRWVRFCFAKQDDVLDAAIGRLSRYFGNRL